MDFTDDNLSPECAALLSPLLEALQHPAVAAKFRTLIPTADEIAHSVSLRLEARFRKMEEELKVKGQLIRDLGARVEMLEAQADDQEQYSRRTSVRIANIKEEIGEDVSSIAMNIFSHMNCTPTINRIHRVGPPRQTNQPPRPILCQFTTYPDKANVMKNRKALKTTHPGIYINEDLTRKRAKILFEARRMKRLGLITDAWSYDGRIAVKDMKNKVHPIRTLSDLNKFTPSSFPTQTNVKTI